MNNLKKAKKIINVNYCFENGDELEIPFVYKPDVMKYIKLSFDEFMFSPMREKGNREYFTALLDSAKVYVKYSGEVTKQQLLNVISEQEFNALVSLDQIQVDVSGKYIIVPMGEQLIHDACAKSLTGQISKMSIKSAYKYKNTYPEKFQISESTNATHAKLNGNYKSTHSIRTLKGA